MLHISHSKNYESECASNICVGNMTGRLRLGKKARFQAVLKGNEGRGGSDFNGNFVTNSKS